MNDSSVEAALARCAEAAADPQPDPVRALAAIVAWLRPAMDEPPAAAGERLARLIDHLAAHEAAAAVLRRPLAQLMSSRRLAGFFAGSGILPPTGFFSELGRIIGHRLLPELPDEDDLRDALPRIFRRSNDWVWLQALPRELSLRLWRVLGEPAAASPSLVVTVQAQVLEALLVLAYRLGGVDAEQEFARLGDQFAGSAPVFRAIAAEAQRFADGLRAHWSGGAVPEDERHLLVLVEQCRQVLARARRSSMRSGTSLRLTYLLLRSAQSLERIETLARLLAAPLRPDREQAALAAWSGLMGSVLAAENRRDSLRHHLGRAVELLALRVTDNAARTGEHYVADTPAALRGMWRAAMGAGAIIAVLSLLKIFASKLSLAPAGYALLYSLIYGLGFVLVYVLHLTIATKQPAMTAQTIATRLGELEPGHRLDLAPAADLIVAVARTQFAAIVGNVMVALPTAVGVSLLLGHLRGAPPLDVGKGAALLADLDPASLAPLYAAIAGVFLFLSGVLNGWFDNWAAYARVGARVERLRWLRALAGRARAARAARYLEKHLGGLMGNFLFGCMLGSAGTVGLILGLPIDIRHIAFAAANLGHALVAFNFALPWTVVAWAALGVALIGAINLAVSFTLALIMALKARGVVFNQTRALLAAVWQRLRTRPALLWVASRDAGPGADGP